jgi:DNA-binding transcriptional regulator YiaG
MPNIALVLKEEISRIARKELREEVTQLRKTLSACRADIAELKRSQKALEQTVRSLQKGAGKQAPEAEPKAEGGEPRFSAKRLAAHRQRLELSAADFGLLIGASGQSVYKWEEGKVRPRKSQLPAISALRSISKPQAAARVAALKATAS